MTTELAENHELYFLPDPDAIPIPLGDLVPTKPPSAQPASVDRAEQLMARAARGEIERRAPISVVPDGARYAVLDGNATYGVALRHGWRTLPARVQAADER